jgi:hypothetical protein
MPTVDRIRSDPNAEAVQKLRVDFPSLYKREQFHKFFFKSQRDADNFARAFNPATIPAKDFIEKTWVVHVK